MIKLIIFDYDGVIVDSFPNVHSVYMTICKKLGKKCPNKLEDFKKTYGDHSSDSYDNLGFSEDERIKGNLIFKEEILKKEPKLFEGVIETLERLHRDYKMIVISSSYKEEVEQKLNKFGIRKYFDEVITRETHMARFEKTDSIKKIISSLNLNVEEVLLVGDRNVDFVEGTKAGLKNILLVDYGWGYNLKKIPDYKQKIIVKKPIDILKAVESF
ncbi:MAG: HAD-IA family hydrolase [Nanoarchaeota archaeon]|nr:HAD-IA family hydrolase [Nanoarchaeota archaeon]